MDPTTASTKRSLGSAAKPPGSPVGRQEIADYVGQQAGRAAQAVRRAGLRAGLDRAYGYNADSWGIVVAQEPQAGSQVARNTMVTLYVAAPGSDEPEASAVAAPADEDVTQTASADDGLSAELDEAPDAREAPEAFATDAAPAVSPSAFGPASSKEGGCRDALDNPSPPFSDRRVFASVHGPAPQVSFHTAFGSNTGRERHHLADEVTLATDVFAGQVGVGQPEPRAAFRRTSHARLQSRASEWAAEHVTRRRLIAAVVVLCVLIVAAATAHHRPTASPQGRRSVGNGSIAQREGAPTRIRTDRRRKTARRRPRARRRARGQVHGKGAVKAVRRSASPDSRPVRTLEVEPANAAPSSTPSSAVVSPSAPASEPASEQTEGGPFSP